MSDFWQKDDMISYSLFFFFFTSFCIERLAMLIRAVFVHV